MLPTIWLSLFVCFLSVFYNCVSFSFKCCVMKWKKIFLDEVEDKNAKQFFLIIQEQINTESPVISREWKLLNTIQDLFQQHSLLTVTFYWSQSVEKTWYLAIHIRVSVVQTKFYYICICINSFGCDEISRSSFWENIAWHCQFLAWKVSVLV